MQNADPKNEATFSEKNLQRLHENRSSSLETSVIELKETLKYCPQKDTALEVMEVVLQFLAQGITSKQAMARGVAEVLKISDEAAEKRINRYGIEIRKIDMAKKGEDKLNHSDLENLCLLFEENFSEIKTSIEKIEAERGVFYRLSIKDKDYPSLIKQAFVFNPSNQETACKMAIQFRQDGFIDKSITLFTVTYEAARKNRNTVMMARCLNGIAGSELAKGNPEEAEKLYFMAIKLTKNKVFLNLFYGNLSALYTQKQDYSKAIDFLDKAVKNLTKMKKKDVMHFWQAYLEDPATVNLKIHKENELRERMNTTMKYGINKLLREHFLGLFFFIILAGFALIFFSFSEETTLIFSKNGNKVIQSESNLQAQHIVPKDASVIQSASTHNDI